MSPQLVLAGVAGHGRTYLREVVQLERDGLVELAGVCELAELDAELRELIGDRPVGCDLGQLLTHTDADIGIVATPIHLHEQMARAVLDAGADLLLEKPPAPTLAGWRQLVAHPGSELRQVGFQSLGSQAFLRLRAALRAGELGAIHGIGVYGAWSRPDGYYLRAPWAGRRYLGDVAVSDGALTNPFAHGIALALALDSSTREADIVSVEPELWRAHDIETDDTSCVRVRTARGTQLVIAATLCADVEVEPTVVVHGSRGRAELHYTEHRLVLDGRTHRLGATSALCDLLARRIDRQPLQAALADCGGFMHVLEAIRLAAPPRPVAPQAVRVQGSGAERRVTVPDSAATMRTAAERLALFSELGLAWAEV